ncbi:aspartate/glutamate racemase family protein [Gilvibacter sp.]|uniref:aspartate/glutamate racemase family protein n=1 Tax=Gilvibacter sp. TaxID=2729997 RepID=UPI003F4A4871
MKKIGLIGGMSWESSHVYYKLINEMIKERLGGFHSARILLESVDFSVIEGLMQKDDWPALEKQMISAAQNLEAGGADMIVLCTNSMHLCTDAITTNIVIPFIHIADATAVAIKQQQLQKVLLLGTRFTMSRDFYKLKLLNDHGIDVIIPDPADAQEVDRIIFEELVQGIVLESSKATYQRIIEKAAGEGAEGAVLGCTEIPMLIAPEDVSIPTFDTTYLHAQAAVNMALL